MTLKNCVTNLENISANIKSNIFMLHHFSDMFLTYSRRAFKSDRDEKNEYLTQIVQFDLAKQNCALNIILNTSFFLESFINLYSYLNNTEQKHNEFMFLSTSNKWSEILQKEKLSSVGEIKDLFDFNNFLTHSKPFHYESTSTYQDLIKTDNNLTEWIKIEDDSCYSKEMPLRLINFSIKVGKLFNTISLYNRCVNQIFEICPGFKLHNSLIIDMELLLDAHQLDLEAKEIYQER